MSKRLALLGISIDPGMRSLPAVQIGYRKSEFSISDD